MGRPRSRHAGVSRSAASAGAEGSQRRCSQELGALDTDGRITAEGTSLRALALPPRLARMIVDSHRLGRGRGGGRDRRHPDRARPRRRQRRSRCQARPVPPRPLAARSQRPAAWRSAGRSRWLRRKGRPARTSRPPPASCWRWRFPDRVARNRGNGSFVLANGRGAAVEQTSSLARAPYIAVAELTGTAAQGRILLAAPITHEEIEARFADQIENSERRFRSIAARWRCARAASGRCTRSRCRKRRCRAVALRGDRAGVRRRA